MKIKRYPYCIQCVDLSTGKTGDFAYDPSKGHYAITPVFDDLGEFYSWCKQHQFYYHHGRGAVVTEGEI